jgi:CRISPR-associated exonuclease Cas4
MGLEPISASDLERFGYCPLSWWLRKASDVTSDDLEEGDRKHEALANDLTNIVHHEQKAGVWDNLVLLFSIIATVLGVAGVLLLQTSSETASAVLAVISIFWIASAMVLVFRSAHLQDRSLAARYERPVTIMAIIAVVVALNSVTILQVKPDMAFAWEVIALIWLIGASLALYFSLSLTQKAEAKRRERRVDGTISYVDTNHGSRLLRSAKYGLSGRPDYILKVEGEQVPVEVKSGRTPRGPLFSHILQVAAYCLLLSEETGKPVSHGILRYETVEHEIEFDGQLRNLLLQKLDEMRQLSRTGNVHRNHNRPGKCANCSRREMCPERLA